MSLAIDINSIVAVKLQGDGPWTPVVRGSFKVDAYEFVNALVEDEKRDDTEAITSEMMPPTLGFKFVDQLGGKIMGPITAIVAVEVG